ncbi:MAG: hypothetical protein PHR26_02405 [Candidatus ainarchaeum sp.]|nr:hypothetical protein [Candidatus ainarchaeum sp.]
MKKNVNSRMYLVIGVIIIALVLFSAGIFASPIDGVNVTFEKSTYNTMEDLSLRINYTIENKYAEDIQLLVYAECDSEELECSYSKTMSLNGYSSKQTSLIVKSIDEGKTDLKIYVRDMLTNEENYFSIDIETEDDLDEGDFEVDVSDRSYCIGQSNHAYFTFEDVKVSDLYYLELSSEQFPANIREDLPIFLRGDDEKVDFIVDLQNDVMPGNYEMVLKIYNDDIVSYKTFNVNVNDCSLIQDPEFRVIYPQTSYYVLEKDKPKEIEFTIKNLTRYNKTIFINHSEDLPFGISFSDIQIDLEAYASQEVTLEVVATQDVPSGTYPLDITFFDEITTYEKTLTFAVSPESNLISTLLQSSLVVKFGEISQFQIVLDNLGDFDERIDVSFVSSNDLEIDILNDSFIIPNNSKGTINIRISTGNNSKEMTSNLNIILDSKDSDYSEVLILPIVVIKQINNLNLSILSLPQELTLDSNSENIIFLNFKNTGLKDIIISDITFAGISQEISVKFESNILISSGETKEVSGKINISELISQKQDAVLIIRTDSGQTLTRNIILNITDNNIEELDDNKKFGLTGFVNLSSSIFIGIVVFCLLLIVLFATGVLRTKHRN